MVPQDPARLRADAARNVERIVDAAHVVFSASGRVASMDDVAAAARVGVATVYRRFPTKQDLLRTVLERRWDELINSALARRVGVRAARSAAARV